PTPSIRSKPEEGLQGLLLRRHCQRSPGQGNTQIKHRCVLRFGGEPLHLADLQNSDAERAYGFIRENLVRYQTPLPARNAGLPPVGITSIEQNLGTQSMQCGKCGQKNTAGSTKCSACGSPL